jgi:hypothetical protein
MNLTLAEIEIARQSAAYENFMAQPRLTTFHWHVTRPAKRGKGRVHVAYLYFLTKQEFAEWWRKNRQPCWKTKCSKTGAQ